MGYINKKRIKTTTDPKENKALIEAYIQSSNNARAYMDLRFKHFTTFVVLTAMVGTATFRIPVLKDLRDYFTAVAALLTVLFWCLDFRTGQYLKNEMSKAKHYQKELQIELPVILEKPICIISASTTTNIVFIIIFLFWIVATMLSFVQVKTETPESNISDEGLHHVFNININSMQKNPKTLLLTNKAIYAQLKVLLGKDLPQWMESLKTIKESSVVVDSNVYIASGGYLGQTGACGAFLYINGWTGTIYTGYISGGEIRWYANSVADEADGIRQFNLWRNRISPLGLIKKIKCPVEQ